MRPETISYRRLNLFHIAENKEAKSSLCGRLLPSKEYPAPHYDHRGRICSVCWARAMKLGIAEPLKRD